MDANEARRASERTHGALVHSPETYLRAACIDGA